MDILTGALQNLSFSGMLFSQPTLKHPWGIQEDAINGYLFHYAVSGDLKFRLVGSKKWLDLEEGDFVLLPSGEANIISSSEKSKVTHIKDILPSMINGEQVIVGGKGQTYKVLCGCYTSNEEMSSIISNEAKRFYHIKKSELEDLGLKLFLSELIEVSSGDELGKALVIDSLLKIIFLRILRSLIETHQVQGPIPGIFSDPVVHKVSLLFMRDLRKKWSLEKLTKEVGVSRNALINKFNDAVGMGPMDFCNYIKVHRAKELLVKNSKIKLKEVAEELGYNSVENFLFNFKKFTNCTPKQYREFKFKSEL